MIIFYLRLLAGIYYRQGYLKKALETYEKAYAALQRGEQVHNIHRQEVLERLADLYLKQHEYARAVEMYEQLVLITDKPIHAKFRLAVSLGLDADYRRAIRLFEEVRAARPDAAVVYGKLGYAYELSEISVSPVILQSGFLAIDPGGTIEPLSTRALFLDKR
ncbi:MAG: hypothetical protein R2838_24930 [Caldilineaceae bacterium]